jgi:hypothetical protein
LPVALLEVSPKLVQKVFEPEGVSVGVAGIGLTVTTVAADGGLVQPVAVVVTV